MKTKKKSRTRVSKEKHGLSKIASFTTKSITSAISNYKKNKEQNKIRAIIKYLGVKFFAILFM